MSFLRQEASLVRRNRDALRLGTVGRYRFFNSDLLTASVDRASELLELNRRGTLDDAAREELNQLEFAELLMQSVKARIRRKTTETKSSP